jgi:peptidoglycan/LPS O-acetylase OafA/YrhL
VNAAFSAFLDLLRILAASTVFASHAALYRIGPHPALQSWAHDGVIGFFVLSGYLVSYSALKRERTAGGYALARAARIYSVALPALAITLALDYAGRAIDPAYYREYLYEGALYYFPFFLLFASDLWFLSETAFSNVPFWSLCYEVWYYVLFGVVAFSAGRTRTSLIALVLLIMGPKLWLLLPLWALGSAILRLHGRVRLGAGAARLLLLLALAGFLALKVWRLDDALDDWVNAALGGFPEQRLRYSKWFLGDYLVGGCFGLAIFAARDAALGALGRPATKRALSEAASYTFTLYLLHFPLLLFFSVALGHDTDSPASLAVLVGATLAGVILIARFTEHRKDVFKRAILAMAAPFTVPHSRRGAAGE